MSRTKRAVLGVVTSFFSYFVLIVLQFFLSPIFLKKYGQETLGLYGSIMQLIGYLTILDAALSFTFNRYIAQAFGSSETSDLNRSFVAARILTTLAGLVNAALMLLAIFIAPVIFNVSASLKVDLTAALVLLSASTLLRAPLNIYGIFLNAGQQMAFLNLVNLGAGLLRAGLVLGFVVFNWGITGVVLGTVVSELASSGACYVFFKRKFRSFNLKGWTIDTNFLKEVGLFAKDALLIQVLNKIRFQTDVMLVGAFLSLSAASVFYSSTTPAMMCFTLANLLMSNTLPGINEIIGTGDIDKVKVIYLKVLRYVLLLSAVAIFGITFCNKYVVLLWVGEGQYGGIIIDVLIALQVGLLILNSFNGNFLVAMGKVKKISRVSAIITFVGLGLSMILVKTVGMTGLLVSSVGVLLYGTVFFLWQIESLFGEKIYRNFNTYFPR